MGQDVTFTLTRLIVTPIMSIRENVKYFFLHLSSFHTILDWNSSIEFKEKIGLKSSRLGQLNRRAAQNSLSPKGHQFTYSSYQSPSNEGSLIFLKWGLLILTIEIHLLYSKMTLIPLIKTQSNGRKLGPHFKKMRDPSLEGLCIYIFYRRKNGVSTTLIN